MSDATPASSELLDEVAEKADGLKSELQKAVVGQKSVIDDVLLALFCGEHAILTGVPGLAKTLLIRSLSSALDLTFSRIQFTPDLMPSDIVGTEIIDEDRATGHRELRFIHGPIFTNILLADEINRTPPKTQAALLEAMEERQVTVAGEMRKLEQPFYVLATQNPIELEGTYPLPEAQLDRFMLNINIDYLDEDAELEVATTTTSTHHDEPQSIFTGKDMLDFSRLVRMVPVAEPVARYAVRLSHASRPGSAAAPDFVKDWVSWGAGTRGSQNLVLAAKARALLEGRFHVSVNDIKRVAYPVLRHRILTNFRAEADHVSPEDIIRRLIESVEEPRSNL